MRSTYATGIYTGCALTLAYQFGQPKREKTYRAALRRLKRKRYINYPRGVGKKGGYTILIHNSDYSSQGGAPKSV